jgi:hypothetical protein
MKYLKVKWVKSQFIYQNTLADVNERERIGKNGRNYVRENYLVEKIVCSELKD